MTNFVTSPSNHHHQRRVAVIIQARLGSSRFPRKVLAPIEGKPMLQRVYERARMIDGIDDCVIAVPQKDHDLIDWIRRTLGACMVLGSEDDVLDRYYAAATSIGADVIVRLTGDCPLLDADLASDVLRDFLQAPVDYASNLSPAADGTDCEVFSRSALRCAWARSEDREHVTSWLRSSPCVRRLALPLPGEPVHLSVDTADDLEVVRAIYRHVGRDSFGWADALRALAAIEVPA